MALENNSQDIKVIVERLLADEDFKASLQQIKLAPNFSGNQLNDKTQESAVLSALAISVGNAVGVANQPVEVSPTPKEQQYDVEVELTMAELLQPDRKLSPAEEALKNLLEYLFSPEQLAEMTVGDVRNIPAVIEQMMRSKLEGLAAEYAAEEAQEQSKIEQAQENEHEEDFLEGDVLEGDVLEGDALEGDVLEGDVLEGDVLEGDVLEGEINKKANIKDAAKEKDPPNLNDKVPEKAEVAVVDVNVGMGGYQHKEVAVNKPDATPSVSKDGQVGGGRGI